MNLITNAKDATENKEYREIIISLMEDIENNLVLSVIDTGEGIADDIKR